MAWKRGSDQAAVEATVSQHGAHFMAIHHPLRSEQDYSAGRKMEA